MAFKEQFRSVDVLMIDDVQFISGKDSTQEEFFHTFNALVDQQPPDRDLRRQVALRPRGPGGAHALAARLGPGRRHPPDDLRAARSASCRPRPSSSAPTIPPKVLEFLAHKITSNVRELEGALNRVVAHATLVGRDDHARD